MISKSAVRRFLRRRLRDSRKAKRFSERAVDAKIGKLDPAVGFVTDPYLHQKVCFLLGVLRLCYAFFLDMGLGKTKVALDLIAHMNAIERDLYARRAIVLVPYGSNVPEWEHQASIHAPHLKCVGLDKGGEHRADMLEDTSIDVVVSTYAGLLHYTSDKSTKKWKPDPTRCENVAEWFGVWVLDESSYVKSHTSLIFNTLKRVFAMTNPARFLLTGTPFGKDPSDLWSQFYLLDGGETLGQTLGMFRAAFCVSKRNYWGGWEHRFRKEMTGTLNRMIANRSIRYAEAECLDLPELVGGITSGNPMVRPVEMTSTAEAYYNKVTLELRESKGNFQLVESAFMRMRQITAGWLGAKDDTTGEKLAVALPDHPKLDALIELLTEIPQDEKVVVFNVYHVSGDLVCKALTSAKVPHVRLYGKTSKKGRRAALDRFRTGNARVLVASEAGAFGLNLQAATRVVFFESPVSPIIRRQMEKRCHRGGQDRRVFIYDLVVKDSVDDRIVASLESGRDLFEMILEGARV